MTLAIIQRVTDRFRPALLLLATCLLPLLVHAANITSVSPTVNLNSVAASSNITVVFDAAILASDVNSTTFRVTGSQSGSMAGTFAGQGTSSISFNPTYDFKAGEIITVTLTTGLGLATPYSWRFMIASSLVVANFTHSVPVTTSANGARSVYAADVDGDNDIDILSASFFSGAIAWYENVGSETFIPHTITTSLVGAYSVHAADVDNDGDMDVLSASNNDNKIAWYENDGTESFTAHIVTTAAAGASCVYASDVDSDGDMDILSASNIDNKIAWYENNGASTFSPHTITTSAITPYSVYVADVDRDGDMDVLSASAGDNKIAWYENNGAQVFTARVITTAAPVANSVYAGDMDGDGDMDVLSAAAGTDEITWYENNGSQVFTKRIIATTADGARSVYMADVDGDGDQDVMSASSLDDEIAWYENNGSQVFALHTLTTSASSAFAVYAADVDGDGDIDILSASMNDDKIVWYKNSTPPVVVPAAKVLTVVPTANAHRIIESSVISVTFDTPIPATAVTMANFKVSGVQTGNVHGTLTGGGTNTITFDPTHNFKAGEVITVTLTPELGLAHGYSWQFTVASAAVTPAFVTIPPVTTNALVAYSVYAADMDDDGDADLVSSSVGDDKVAWYENAGSPILIAHSAGLTPVPTSIYPTDLDDDGDMDVLATSNASNLVWYENNGSTLFTLRNIPATTTEFVMAADIDGDGDKDILSSGSNKIVVHLNDGIENFTLQTITTDIQGWSSVHVADVDGDGDLDILSASEDDYKIAWYENDHSTVFTSHVIAADRRKASSVYTADIDGDGDLDVISAAWYYGEVDWYENDGAEVFTRRSITTEAADVQSVYAADFDGDGDMDVLSSSLVTKEVYWHENNGLGVFSNRYSVGTGVDGAMTLNAADVDGDGDMDVMSASLNDHKIAWFPNNLPPVIAGAVADQTTNDYSTITMFSPITVTDRDVGQKLLIAVQLDVAAKGGFTSASLAASGFISVGSGNYTFSGTAEEAQDALRLLVFMPTPGRMSMGNSETVRLTITASDAISQTVTNDITTVIVTAIAPPNNAPSFTKGLNIEVNEDVPLQNLTAWATNVSPGPASESNQTVNFILTNDNVALFAAQPAIDATGTLTFEPTADASGAATVTAIIKDDGGTAHGGVDQSEPIIFVITISPVNDAPVADPLENVTIELGSAPAELTLTGLHPGTGEDNQKLTVTASSDAPSLLANPPVTLNSNGTAILLLTPMPNALGTVTVTVVIQDDGGTARGGHDATAISFSVTIEQEAVAPVVFIPTLFSPNGDGNNDALRVRAAGIADIRFSVYSADGHEVFRTTDINEATETGWNGRYHDRDMPAGTYTWTLRGHFTDGSPLTFGNHSYGQVVLLR